MKLKNIALMALLLGSMGMVQNIWAKKKNNDNHLLAKAQEIKKICMDVKEYEEKYGKDGNPFLRTTSQNLRRLWDAINNQEHVPDYLRRLEKGLSCT